MYFQFGDPLRHYNNIFSYTLVYCKRESGTTFGHSLPVYPQYSGTGHYRKFPPGIKDTYGTVHFLRGRGGWWDLGGGGHVNKKGLKGGPTKKNKGEGGVT